MRKYGSIGVKELHEPVGASQVLGRDVAERLAIDDTVVARFAGPLSLAQRALVVVDRQPTGVTLALWTNPIAVIARRQDRTGPRRDRPLDCRMGLFDAIPLNRDGIVRNRYKLLILGRGAVADLERQVFSQDQRLFIKRVAAGDPRRLATVNDEHAHHDEHDNDQQDAANSLGRIHEDLVTSRHTRTCSGSA